MSKTTFKKAETIRELVDRVDTALETIMISSNKRKITRAFAELKCLITGKCICELCPGWPDENGMMYMVYEMSRCLVPTRALQLIRDRHIAIPSAWLWIKPLYTDLYTTLMEDIDPTNPDETPMSSDDMEDQPCVRKNRPTQLFERALKIVLKERQARKNKLLKKKL
jgi:hypothetical protein